MFFGYPCPVQFYQPQIDITKHKYNNRERRRSIKSSKRLICVYASVNAGVTHSPGMQFARVFEQPHSQKKFNEKQAGCKLKNKHGGKIMGSGISSSY